MGGRGARSMSSGGGAVLSNAQTTARTYTAMTDAEASQIRNDVDDRYDIDAKTAIKEYISKNPYDKALGSGYSISQDMNYRLDNGMKLDATEAYMDSEMSRAMHNLGKDTILYRAAHQDILQSMGIQNYDRMSESQLKSALVGGLLTTKSYTSTAYDYNKSPFTTGALAGGREIIMNIKAKSDTQVVFGARAQAEIILNKGTNLRITDVRYTGRTASPRSSSRNYKQIQIDCEVE